MKKQKNKIPDDIRMLYMVAGGFALLFIAVISIKQIKNTKKESHLEYTVEKNTFEENLNKSLKNIILKDNDDLTVYYEGTGNQVIDTAWIIPPGEALKVYNTLKNRKLVLITAPPKSGEGKKEDEMVKKEIQDLEQQMYRIFSKYKKFYGWRIRHRCLINEQPDQIIIDIDTTGTKIREVYANDTDFVACKDSMKLQDILHQKIEIRKPKY